MYDNTRTTGSNDSSTTAWKKALQDHFGDRTMKPHIRYGTSEKKRLPALQSVCLPSPLDAQFAGPVYLMTEDQIERQEECKSPYAVRGGSNIAKVLQDECEANERVLYPVYVESDSLESVSEIDAMIPPLSRFVETRLNLQPGACTWWYSGNRSIHVHTPLFVTDSERKEVTRQAKQFNESEGSDVEIDASIYNRKSQFRLPGVEHEDTGLLKVQVETDWTHEQILCEAATSDRDIPRSYTQILEETVRTPLTTYSPLSSQYGARDGDREPDRAEYGVGNEEEYINGLWRVALEEGERRWRGSAEKEVFRAYNAKEFSPYANTGEGNSRSVAVVKVYSGAFSRPEYGRDARLPCHFLYATGGDGNFTKDDDFAPLLLSKHDYSKVQEKERGSYLVVIGGRSRRSRILSVDGMDAVLTAGYLKDHDRESAMKFLTSQGHEVGSSGLCEGRSGVSSTTTSTALHLQRKAQKRGVDALSHQERLHVANGLLQKGGWDEAWDWFNAQYGGRFDPALTHAHLRSVVERYSDLSHVNVPPEPSG